MSGGDMRSDAVRWFNLRRSGDATDADADAFDTWIEGSAEARMAYERIERNWVLLGNLARDPGIMASRERDAGRYGGPSRMRWFLAAAAAALLVVTSSLSVRSGIFHAAPEPAAGQVFRTGPSQHASTTLADGSMVTLDANTELHVIEMRTRRRIELTAGHAFFRVAKDASRPFLVTAIDKTVHAIGTAFDVRIAGDTVTVTLVEGKVRVDEPTAFLRRSRTADMVPGRQLVATSDRPWTLSPINPTQEMNWLVGRLTFLRDPLAKAVADVNSTSTRKIVFVGGAVPSTRIVGVFRAGDVDAFAKAMEMNGIAHVVSQTDDRIEMAAN